MRQKCKFSARQFDNIDNTRKLGKREFSFPQVFPVLQVCKVLGFMLLTLEDKGATACSEHYHNREIFKFCPTSSSSIEHFFYLKPDFISV